MKSQFGRSGRISSLLALVAVLSFISVPAIAQEELEEVIQEEVIQEEDMQEEDDIFEMSLEELLTLEVESSATLTETSVRKQPAAMTVITAEQIQRSGARNLYELLDIYVPNMQWLRHHWEQDNLGLRGIHSDRDDKYMILVNGLIMNERTHFGAFTEKDLPYLGDIYKIDVVRGPGSALYGPGAIAMVINITTFSADTFEGADVTTRVGAIDEFYTTEFRFGHKIDKDSGVFLYGGLGKYIGADQHDAPFYSGFSYPTETPWGDTTPFPADGTAADEKLLNPLLPRDGAPFRDQMPLKLYGEYAFDDYKVWARYTRGGQYIVWHPYNFAKEPWGIANTRPEKMDFMGAGYQQISSSIEHTMEISDQTTLFATVGYTLTDFDQYWSNTVHNAYREDKYNARVMLRHHFNDDHQMAVGAEYLHNELGLPSLGWPHQDVWIDRLSGSNMSMQQWSTDLYSVMGEYQFNIDTEWTAFIGARLDDHTYTDEMFSPRAALVYAPNDKDTWKVLWSRSVRSNYEDEMRAQYLISGDKSSQPEKLDSLELRYERNHNPNLSFAASAFVHYNLQVTGWSQSLLASVPVGTQRDYGFELEASYHTDRTYFDISHGYTKLYDFNLEVGEYSLITVMPNGFGNDLARWSNHSTKMTAGYKINDLWSVDSSLRIYWGFPGLKDMVAYYFDRDDYPMSDNGWEKAFRGNYYLDMGFQYKPSDNLTLRVDGFNLLGLIDPMFNKRNYNEAAFRSHAASVAFTVRYAF